MRLGASPDAHRSADTVKTIEGDGLESSLSAYQTGFLPAKISFVIHLERHEVGALEGALFESALVSAAGFEPATSAL